MNDRRPRRRRSAPGTRVVIVDRRAFDRLALETLCQYTPGVIVCASVASVSEAVRALGDCPGVVLLGRQSLLVEGQEAVSRLRAAGAERVILVRTGDRTGLQAEAKRVGADGALQRDGDATSQAHVLHGASGAVPPWRDHSPGRPPSE